MRSLLSAIAARPRLSALLGATAISFSGILYLFSNTSPESASAWRCLYGLPLLLLAARMERRSAGPLPRRGVLLAAFAGILFAGDLIFWHHTIEFVGAGLATVLGNLQVVLVTIGAWILLGERPSGRTLAALPVVLVGVALIAGVVTQEAYGADPPLGVALGVVAALFYAAYLMIIRQVNHGRTAEPVAISTISTGLTAVAAGVVLGSLEVPALESHFWLILLGLSTQSLGYLFISYSLPRLPAVVTSIILLAQPVLAVFEAMLLVGEAPSVEQLAGVGLVIGGIALATVKIRRPFRRSVAVSAP